MGKRSISGWVVSLTFLGILVGILGGGVMGGVAGYLVVLAHPASVATTRASTEAVLPSRIANLSVTEDSAVIETVKKAEPAVVTIISNIQTRSTRRGPGGSAIAEGSGVIIDAGGHILTNNHVIQGAQDIQVQYSDGTQVAAQLVGADSAKDIAILKVTGKVPAFLSLGDSQAVALGETVIAIGNPLGNYPGSVSVGIVSGLNRTVPEAGYDGLIQTDAAINHGDSGGPLLNLSGQIIGINTLVVRDTTGSADPAQGLGFAIPSNTVSTIAKQLIAAAQ